MLKHNPFRNIALTIGLAILLVLPGSNQASAQPASTSPNQIVQRTRELLIKTEGLRGLDFKGDLPVELVSRDRIIQIIKAELDKEIPPDVNREASALYSVMGLMPPGADFRKAYEAMIQDQAAGLYDPYDKKFYVVNMNLGDILGGLLGSLGKTAGNLSDQALKTLGVDIAGQMFDMTAVHELTHAIDDQHYDLEGHMAALEKGNSDDAAMAYQCVAEGDANRVMIDYVRSMGLDMSMADSMTGSGLRMMEGMMGYDPFVERLSIAPYLLGQTFVDYVYARKGVAGLEQIFTDPPISMEQVIHPERYELVRDIPSKVADPNLAKVLPGWKREAVTSFGEAVISFMIERKNTPEYSERVADGWDGDRITSWRAPNGDIAAGWVTTWDDSTQAAEFYQAYLDLIPKRYGDLGVWQYRYPQRATYTGMNRAVSIEIKDKTVCIAEGVPQDKASVCMLALWKTKVVGLK